MLKALFASLCLLLAGPAYAQVGFTAVSPAAGSQLSASTVSGGSGGIPGCGSDPAPIQAANVGFNCETFSWNSSVDTAAAIDTTHSQTAGFKWYGNAPWPNAGVASSQPYYHWKSTDVSMTYNTDYTLSGGNLTIQGNYTANPNVTGELMTCSPGPGGVGVVGQTFTGGWYIETVATWNAGPGGYTNGRSPLVWTTPTEWWNGGISGTINYVEVDDHESQYLTSSIHYWTFALGIQSNNTLLGSSSPAADTSGQPYGMLSATAAQNGGQATLKLYHNNVVTWDFTGTYPDSNTNALTNLTQNHSCILLQGDGTPGASWPMNVQRVRVWQAHP